MAFNKTAFTSARVDKIYFGLAIVAATALWMTFVHANPYNTPQETTVGTKLGINLTSVNDWDDHQMTFVDVMKNARGFAAVNHAWDPANYPVPVDAEGWPTTDFGVSFLTGVPDPLNRPMPSTYPSLYGTYHLSFRGKATISGLECCEIRNAIYDPATGTTTADVVVGPKDTLLRLGFTETANGVQDIRLLRPGYPSGTNQVFTNEFLNALKPFGTIRFMSWLPGSSSRQWSERPLPKDILQSGPAGVAWEYVIQLANIARKDIWINIPQGVDLADPSPDNYAVGLARLMKANLDPGIRVYLEYSNEIWYDPFRQAPNEQWAAAKDVNSGADPTLDYDGIGNPEYWRWRRAAHQIVRISQLFREVYGADAMNSTIRPVLMSWYDRPAIAEDSLYYIAKNFGPPNRYIYATGSAPYFKLINGYHDVDSLFSSLQAGLDSVLSDFSGSPFSGGKTNNVASYKPLADYYGLKNFSYEGGPDFGFGETTPAKAAMLEQAVGNRRLGQMMQTYLANWFGCGNDLFIYFSLAGGTGSHYGVYQDVTVPTVKSDELAAIAAMPLAKFTKCSWQ